MILILDLEAEGQIEGEGQIFFICLIMCEFVLKLTPYGQ